MARVRRDRRIKKQGNHGRNMAVIQTRVTAFFVRQKTTYTPKK